MNLRLLILLSTEFSALGMGCHPEKFASILTPPPELA
jgi:hypothetical protein